MNEESLGAAREFETTVVKGNAVTPRVSLVATEVPLTIMANETEIATLACTPVCLREFTTGFLFTSGLIRAAGDVRTFRCDEKTWTITVDLATPPEPKHLFKRLYTSGCGKGVMYSSVIEVMGRFPLDNAFSVSAEKINTMATWLQTCSVLHKNTGGVHAAALSEKGETPRIMGEDIGRHNAVDKVIGAALLSGTDLGAAVLLTTGRASSEIVHKARRGSIPVVVSLGAPTHQAVLLAREMRLTLIGFARGVSFTVFSGQERITYDHV